MVLHISSPSNRIALGYHALPHSSEGFPGFLAVFMMCVYRWGYTTAAATTTAAIDYSVSI